MSFSQYACSIEQMPTPQSYWVALKMLHSQRRRSKGFMLDPIANPCYRVLLGNCERMTPEFIKEKHITHVINCAEDLFAPEHVKIPGRYVCMNARDTLTTQIFLHYPQFSETLKTFLKDPECENVYVHCQAGMNRSAFLVCAWLVMELDMSPIDAISRIVEERPCVMTNLAFLQQLFEFAKKRD